MAELLANETSSEMETITWQLEPSIRMAYDCIARFSQPKDISLCKLTQPMAVSQRHIFEKVKLKRQSQRPAVAHESGCETQNVLDIYILFVARINLEPTLTETVRNRTRTLLF